MKRCKSKSDCEVSKKKQVKVKDCAFSQSFQSKWYFQGYFYYSGYNVEACTLYSNTDDQYFTQQKDGTAGHFCRHPADLLDDASSFAGRKCENFDCTLS